MEKIQEIDQPQEDSIRKKEVRYNKIRSERGKRHYRDIKDHIRILCNIMHKFSILDEMGKFLERYKLFRQNHNWKI